MNLDKERITENFVICAVYITIFFIIVMGASLITNYCNKEIETTEILVDGKIIDSLQRENTILLEEVNKLDSINNEEIKKVKSLDNDSTLKLFYELIGK